MSPFFWTSGHLGWGIFSALIFSGVWLLMGDIAWRLWTTRVARLIAVLATSWTIGIIAILLVAWPAG